jgi:hypothetical protein
LEKKKQDFFFNCADQICTGQQKMLIPESCTKEEVIDEISGLASGRWINTQNADVKHTQNDDVIHNTHTHLMSTITEGLCKLESSLIQLYFSRLFCVDFKTW